MCMSVSLSLAGLGRGRTYITIISGRVQVRSCGCTNLCKYVSMPACIYYWYCKAMQHEECCVMRVTARVMNTSANSCVGMHASTQRLLLHCYIFTPMRTVSRPAGEVV